MKPLFLSLQGINSYEEKQEIDFTKLLDFGIFGIFGPTGSGKSTVLDAITLALYGSVARLSGGSKAFICSNCDRAEVIFKFEARSSVYCVQRAYRKTEKDVKTTMRFYRIDDDGEEVLADKNDREVTAAVTAVIGLEYADFTRTVVLPQGKFSEFLMLKGQDRGSMLERVFDLSQFGGKLRDSIKTLTNENKNKLSYLEKTLSSSVYAGIDKKAVKEAETEIKAKRLSVEELLSKKAETTVQLEKYRVLNVEYESYVEFKKELEKSEENAAKLLLVLEKAKEELSAAKNLYEKTAAEREDKLKNLTKEKSKLTQAKALSSELETAESEIKSLLDEHKSENSKLENGRSELADIEKVINDKYEELKKIAEEKYSLKFAAAQRKAANDGANLESETDKLDKERKKINQKITAAEKEIKKSNEIIEANNDLLIKENEKLKLFNKNLAYYLRQNLAKGETCPVCGSIVCDVVCETTQTNEQQISDAEIKNTEDRINQLKIETAKESSSFEKETKSLEESTTEIEKVKNEIKELEDRILSLKHKFSELFKAKEMSFAELAKKIEKSDTMLEKIETYEKKIAVEIDENNKLKEEKRIELNKLEIKLTEIKIAGKEKREVCDKKKQQLTELVGNKSVVEYSEEIQELKTRVSEEFEKVKDSLKEKEIKANGLSEKNAVNISDISNLKKEINKISGKLKDEESDEIPIKLKNFNRELMQINEMIYTQGSELAVADDNLQKMKENLNQADKLRIEMAEEETRNGLLADVTALCRDNKFLRFVASRRLQYVTAEATVRLKKMTGGRFAIESDNSEFVIRDDNNGGVRLSPQSLSGGEIFIVSLCLALALSSKIQMKQNTDIRFFFLDEGFGSLDVATLDMVMNALETLKNEQMAVGLISHVEELKTRIRAKIIVNPAKRGICGTSLCVERE